MGDKRNAYEIIGTNRDHIIRIEGETNKDEFIRMKKNETNKRRKNKLVILKEQLQDVTDDQEQSKLQKRIEKLEADEQLIESAYLEICDQTSRQVYDDKLRLDIKLEDTKAAVDRKLTENAYEILYMSRKICDDKREESKIIDKKLLRMRNALIKQGEDEIKRLQEELKSLEGKKDAESYRRKSGIDGQIIMWEKEIKRVENAYEKIATRELRKAYDVELKHLEEQNEKRIRQSELRRTYKRSQYYDPNLIVQLGYKVSETSEEEKLKQGIGKRENSSGIRFLKREDGTEITVERIGMLVYKNAFNKTGMLDAYRITRTVDEEKKCDIRYTNLNMIDLSRNRETGEPQDKDYYDFVTNVFLSEDSIEGAKYNGGYLGQILKDKDGIYVQDLGDINELSAVMKFNEIKREKIAESKEGESHEK